LVLSFRWFKSRSYKKVPLVDCSVKQSSVSMCCYWHYHFLHSLLLEIESTEMVEIALLIELQCLLPNPKALVAISKDMRAVKFCTNKMLQFQTFLRALPTACWLKPAGTDTHTHPFNGPSSGTTQVSRYQKGKTNLDFTGARDSEWQWHQLGHMQVCTSLETGNHASTSLLKFFYRQDTRPATQPTVSKH